MLPKIIELWDLNVKTDVEAKKLQSTDRQMTTALFMLRCVQMGLSIQDLDLLIIGMVNEMFIESRNDEVADKVYAKVASQQDFDLLKKQKLYSLRCRNIEV